MSKAKLKTYNCGKCEGGRIRTSTLLKSDGVEQIIFKCNLCSHQYTTPEQLNKLTTFKTDRDD